MKDVLMLRQPGNLKLCSKTLAGRFWAAFLRTAALLEHGFWESGTRAVERALPARCRNQARGFLKHRSRSGYVDERLMAVVLVIQDLSRFQFSMKRPASP
ncbi:hypothetical protein [Pararhizobium qamdonense]|uniref:hypothetical protein n=1 Tax=Pararhizobium qamdonense TaxID=3031126 RepID=UPI0023E25EAA|nr:hypothetical protein [Pararhizobium qamdonense]